MGSSVGNPSFSFGDEYWKIWISGTDCTCKRWIRWTLKTELRIDVYTIAESDLMRPINPRCRIRASYGHLTCHWNEEEQRNVIEVEEAKKRCQDAEDGSQQRDASHVAPHNEHARDWSCKKKDKDRLFSLSYLKSSVATVQRSFKVSFILPPPPTDNKTEVMLDDDQQAKLLYLFCLCLSQIVTNIPVLVLQVLEKHALLLESRNNIEN